MGAARRPVAAALVIPVGVRIAPTTGPGAHEVMAAPADGESRGLDGLLARVLRRGHHGSRGALGAHPIYIVALQGIVVAARRRPVAAGCVRTGRVRIAPATEPVGARKGARKVIARARFDSESRGLDGRTTLRFRRGREPVRGARRRGGPPGGCQRREHPRRGGPAASFGHRARSRVYGAAARGSRAPVPDWNRRSVRPLALFGRSAPRKTAPGRPGRVPRIPREGSRAALATAAARATEPTTTTPRAN